MAYNFPYLKDSSFLKQFDKLKLKEQFVKITVLTFNEQPIEEIQGKVINGNFNFDGTSSMRRTGSINLVANKQNDLTKTKNLLSINKKIQVLIGFTNITNQYTEYDIIWFPLGVYVIIAANISNSINGINISLTLHDKMALLNGQCGGVLPASIVLNEIEDIDPETGQYIIKQPTIFQIIQQLINHFGGEQLGKIIIADLNDKAKQVMKWTGSTPLYYATDIDGQGKTYYHFSTNYYDSSFPSGATINSLSYGDNVGYALTQLTYPGQLISKAGDTICTILDQIKNVLGNFEYFYDVNGNFVFQQIKNYLNKSYSNSIITDINNEDYQVDYTSGKSVYTFEDSTIISSITNTPQFQQIKNDFVVWGKRKSLNGNEIPIRYHLAIDNKSIDEERQDNIFTTNNAIFDHAIEVTGDIVQTQGYLVTDYINTLKYNSIIIKQYRGQEPLVSAFYRINLYDSNKTLIDQATIQTIQNDEWLILQTNIINVPYIRFSCPMNFGNNPEISALLGIKRATITNTYHNIKQVTDEYGNIKYVVDNSGVDIIAKDFRTDLLLGGVVAENLATDSNYYYTELQNEWGNIYDVINGKFRDEFLINPENINFFLDFIDTQADIGQYNVKNIGRRTVTIVDDTINCIFEPSMPDIVIIKSDQDDTAEQREYCQNRGLPYVQLNPDIFDMLWIGSTVKSAYEQIKKQLYQYTTFNEQVSLTTLPIYYLEPNTRITIRDTTTGIYGDFMIKSISLPIDTSGTMNISCTKALERL